MTENQHGEAGGPADWATKNPYAASQVSALREDEFLTRGEGMLNPWFSIWLRPRATMRQILDTDPTRQVWLLAALGGIGQTLDQASLRSAGDELPLSAIFGLAIVVGPVSGLIGVYLGGALIGLTGRWLGGAGQSIHVRATLAWGQVPTIWALLLWVPNVALFGSDMFTTEMPSVDTNDAMLGVFLALAAVETIIGIWQLVVVLKCIGEAHQFSAWSALGAVVLAALLVVGVILIPLLIIILLSASLA